MTYTFNYLDLIASTGSNLEAEKAGQKPDITPITTEIVMPVIILLVCKTILTSKP